MNRNHNTLLGPWIRRFLLEHLISERNLSSNTQCSYRDTLSILLPFMADKIGKPIDQLTVDHISTDLICQFLQYIEEARHCKIATRNQRLTAIHSLARFIGEHCPDHIGWCGEIRNIPFKKTTINSLPYLEKVEIDALLASPDCTTIVGRRDHALLLFLYNTGARASEAAQVTIADLELGSSPAVRIVGKGNKVRYCPLWSTTIQKIKGLINNRKPSEPLFLNRYGKQITRFGIHTLVERYVNRSITKMPSLAKKRISPHTIRHTTAVHLLRAGVDINTIRAWLGHVSLSTTNIYAEIDLEMKAIALEKCKIIGKDNTIKWNQDPSLMEFLHSL